MNARPRLLRFAIPLAISALLSVSAAHADEISDAIAAAAKSYQSGELGTAKQSLDLASQLIAQKNAEALVAALPRRWRGGRPAMRTPVPPAAGSGFR